MGPPGNIYKRFINVAEDNRWDFLYSYMSHVDSVLLLHVLSKIPVLGQCPLLIPVHVPVHIHYYMYWTIVQTRAQSYLSPLGRSSSQPGAESMETTTATMKNA